MTNTPTRRRAFKPLQDGGSSRHRFPQIARHEQNAIAHAIAENRFLPNQEERVYEYSDQQLPPDATSAAMADAGARMFRAYRECGRFLLTGETERAREFAQLAALEDREYTRLARAYELTRRVRAGRYNHGDTWLVVIGDTPFFFDLILLYDESLDNLVIANADELRHTSGVLEADDDAWFQLAQWIAAIHEETKMGRPLDNPDEIIWRDDGECLRLRPALQRAFPRLIWALEAIRLTLRIDRNPPEPEKGTA